MTQACDAAQRSWESTLILNGDQPEAVEEPEVALNDPGFIARAHLKLFFHIEIWAYLTYAVCFGFCTHLTASSERDIPVIGRSELIKTRTRVKTHCLKLAIFRNDPFSIHWRKA